MDRIDLSVQTLTGDTINLVVDADESIDSIKGKVLHLIQAIFMQPSDCALFYLEEHLLGSLLAYPDILNGSTLKMVSVSTAIAELPVAVIPDATNVVCIRLWKLICSVIVDINSA